MKLLFDANLSPKLVGRLAQLFPGSVHVFDTGLARATSDEKIWKYAGDDVHLENCDYRTSQVESVLRHDAVRIAELEQSPRITLTIHNKT